MARGLPGNLLELYRDGIKAIIDIKIQKNEKIRCRAQDAGRRV
jgi:hypothetical protein